MIFNKNNHSPSLTISHKSNQYVNNKSDIKIIPIRDFVKENIKMSKNENHIILPEKLDKIMKLKIKTQNFVYNQKKRFKQENYRKSDQGQFCFQFQSGRVLNKNNKSISRIGSKQQYDKQKKLIKEVNFNTNFIDVDNVQKSNRIFRNLKTTQLSSRNKKFSKRQNYKQQEQLNPVKFSNKLLSTFIGLNSECKTQKSQKFFSLGQSYEYKGIEINGYKAPFGETIDHFRLKTACESPNVRQKKQKKYKTITDWS